MIDTHDDDDDDDDVRNQAATEKIVDALLVVAQPLFARTQCADDFTARTPSAPAA